MNEFLEVSNRPKFKKYFSEHKVDNLLKLFDYYGIFVDVKSTVKFCRDPKDDFLLSLAIDSYADYIITGDNDLLRIKTINNTKIITIKYFLANIEKLILL